MKYYIYHPGFWSLSLMAHVAVDVYATHRFMQ
jgi:hypothetical protein